MIIGLCCMTVFVDSASNFSLKLFGPHLLFLSVRFPEDVEDDGITFHPEYSHQLFGDE